jgi:murein L,D-transpeptidase YcbB/YkuD
MRTVLADYRQQAQQGGWPQVPAKLRLKPGQRHAGVRALAQRLAASGDYTGSIPAGGAA